VIICTLHYTHPDYAIKAFSNGLHVLIEKPADVYTKQVREMNEAAASSGLIFGIMYNQRTNPLYAKLKTLIEAGELGEIRRTNWIMTDWYRSQSYYDSGDWRATWSGEGGGVLFNQCPHQLDLWQWTIGMMPTRIRSFCSFGKYRDIEVEDEVTAYVEYEKGRNGCVHYDDWRGNWNEPI
jgi:predicted dehydrogenase